VPARATTTKLRADAHEQSGHREERYRRDALTGDDRSGHQPLRQQAAEEQSSEKRDSPTEVAAFRPEQASDDAADPGNPAAQDEQGGGAQPDQRTAHQ
jgi:hypothetical protein